MTFPENLKYSAEHEWVSLNGDIATIGITDHAQGELGDIVFVDISSVGKAVGQNEVFGSVEAVKTVSDLFMPVAGTVLEVNSHLEGAPEAVNTDAYGNGWMVKVKIEDPAQLDSLMDAAAYKALIGQ